MDFRQRADVKDLVGFPNPWHDCVVCSQAGCCSNKDVQIVEQLHEDWKCNRVLQVEKELWVEYEGNGHIL